MLDVAKELKKGNFTSVVMALLLVIAAITIPLANQKLTEDVVRKIITEEVLPLLIPLSDDVQSIKDFNILDLRDRAIVAYNSKIFTVEDLQPLTQNGLAVRNGLQVPEIRQALFTLDPERTLLFEAYFAGE